jgi:phage shock protein A
MFARIFKYLRTAGRVKAEELMDPAIQIEQALEEARVQDTRLREQAARVIAHRSELQMRLDRAVDTAAGAKENAASALRKADAASAAADAAEVEKWTRVAQSLALELDGQEKLVDGLKAQYETAGGQAELAKQQVSANSMRLKELAGKRMELLGKLEQAKMQEQVNATMADLSKPMESDGPSMQEIEDKINKRMALASAHAELGGIESAAGAKAELERARVESAAAARLDALRTELGMGAGGAAQLGSGGDGAGKANGAGE